MSCPAGITDELLDAVQAAERRARAEHDAGRCGLSEWSCSWCEEMSVRPVSMPS